MSNLQVGGLQDLVSVKQRTLWLTTGEPYHTHYQQLDLPTLSPCSRAGDANPKPKSVPIYRSGRNERLGFPGDTFPEDVIRWSILMPELRLEPASPACESGALTTRQSRIAHTSYAITQTCLFSRSVLFYRREQ
jgi:hypothetical protein